MRHAGQADAIGIGRQLEVVADMHRLHQEAQLLRELAAHAANARQQLAALRLVHQRHQAEADFQADQIDRLHVVPGQFALLGTAPALAAAPAAAAVQPRACLARRCSNQAPAPHSAAEQQERDIGHAGDQPHDAQHAAGDRQTARLTQTVACDQFAAQILRAGHARDDDGDGGGQQQRRNLRHQAITDGQQRVDARRIA